MINRILIRIKVIQILYSFLLVEKNFCLEGQPTSPTKEKRFAYSLYLDLIILLVKVAEKVERRSGDCPLRDTAFISRLLYDETVVSILNRLAHEPFAFSGELESVSDSVKDSGLYKNFLKDSKKLPVASNENIWHDLFNLVIITNPALLKNIEARKDYTLKGLERAKEMVNRTFVSFLASQDNVNDVEKALQTSLEKARELYFRLLYLPVELVYLEERILDENRYKFLKTEADINPNMRFVENKVVDALRASKELTAYVDKNKISWLNDEPVMMRNLLKTIKESEFYKDYMSAKENSVHDDAELWRQLFKQVILQHAEFLETLEDKSVFWNDDLDIMSTFVLKSFRRIEEGDNTGAILDKYKDEEDARFGSELLRYLYRDKDSVRHYIDDAVAGTSWDKDRLAFMDIVIIETAITEIMNFPKIPLQVSVNEYIELAKSYSTENSGRFVHGIIAAIVARFQKEGKLLKK